MIDKKYPLNTKTPFDDDEESLVADEEQPPLIPDGNYRVHCIGAMKKPYLNSLKLYVWFKIIEPFYDTELYMAIPLSDYKTGKPFKKVPRGSKFYKQWTIANGDTPPASGSKMAFKIFKGGEFEAVVRTVKPKFPDGGEKPECFHYSVVDYLKRRLL